MNLKKSREALIGVWLALRNAHLEHEAMERAVFKILDEDRLDLSKVARDNLERLLSIAVALSSGPLARVRFLLSCFRTQRMFLLSFFHIQRMFMFAKG